MAQVVTFGEIMMRLTVPGNQRFYQADQLGITYGGGEANVSAALAYMGVTACHVTVMPENDLGQACTSFFRKTGLDCRHFYSAEGRLGLYFMEVGEGLRPSKIVYDRYQSAFAHLDPRWFNWEEILEGAAWFHWTGITPAVSAVAAQACAEALAAARRKGIMVSADVNYRRVLWKYGKKAAEIMPELVAQCDLAVCTEGDAADMFGIHSTGFEDMAHKMMDKFPNLKHLIATRRESVSASCNRITGLHFDGKTCTESSVFELDPIVDRIGGGDAFIAGFIYGQLHQRDIAWSLHFGIAASALKHMIVGDFNLASVAEIEQVMGGDTAGRLLR